MKEDVLDYIDKPKQELKHVVKVTQTPTPTVKETVKLQEVVSAKEENPFK